MGKKNEKEISMKEEVPMKVFVVKHQQSVVGVQIEWKDMGVGKEEVLIALYQFTRKHLNIAEDEEEDPEDDGELNEYQERMEDILKSLDDLSQDQLRDVIGAMEKAVGDIKNGA